MSEETKTTTNEEKKTVLWANVPWGVLDQQTEGIQVTGNVDPNYLSLVLAKQLQEKEKELVVLKQELDELKKTTAPVDTSTSDI